LMQAVNGDRSAGDSALMSNPFTARELAIGIWTCCFIARAATNAGVRKSFANLVRTALTPKLSIPFLASAAYVALAVGVLDAIGLWTRDLLKDTILWFLFAGVPLAFAGVSHSSRISWRRVIADQLRAVVIVEYLVNTYTFSLVTELLLVPVLTTVVLLDTLARDDPKFTDVSKLTGWLQALFGFGVLGVAVHQALANREHFEVMNAFRAIAVVPLLSILLLPCTFVFALLSAYEGLFVRLGLGRDMDPGCSRYAKRLLFKHLGFRPEAVRTFTTEHAAGLMRVRTNADIEQLISQARR